MVNVEGDINLSNKGLIRIPWEFGSVSGNFDCHYNNLSSLYNAPFFVGKNFNCSHNQLVSIEYCPIHIGGDLSCNDNELEGLKFCPKYIGGNVWCYNNPIKSFKDASLEILMKIQSIQTNPLIKMIPIPIEKM